MPGIDVIMLCARYLYRFYMLYIGEEPTPECFWCVLCMFYTTSWFMGVAFICRLLSNNIFFVGMKQSWFAKKRNRVHRFCIDWRDLAILDGEFPFMFQDATFVFLWNLCRLVFSWSGPCGCGQALIATDFLKVKDIQEHNLCYGKQRYFC
jgi:hypothetical protein